MSRCSICDYSQSADSSYNSGLQLNRSLINNRVIFDKKTGTDLCLACLEEHHHTLDYWTYIDEQEGFNAFIPSDDDVSEYEGCTEKPAD